MCAVTRLSHRASVLLSHLTRAWTSWLCAICYTELRSSQRTFNHLVYHSQPASHSVHPHTLNSSCTIASDSSSFSPTIGLLEAAVLRPQVPQEGPEGLGEAVIRGDL